MVMVLRRFHHRSPDGHHVGSVGAEQTAAHSQTDIFADPAAAERGPADPGATAGTAAALLWTRLSAETHEIDRETERAIKARSPRSPPSTKEKPMSIIRTALVVLVTFAPVASAIAEESTPPGQHCPVDTTTDKSTGKPRSGVQVCGGDGSASVGFSATDKEIGHFFEYPIGTSDKSVAKQVGNATHKAAGDIGSSVHSFFHHL
jgi:hypothetical protein